MTQVNSVTVIDRHGRVSHAVVPYVSADRIDDVSLPIAVQCPNDHIPPALLPMLDRIAAIRIDFPNAGDGRGFSIARALRQYGFRNRLCAGGRLISDQFSFAIDCGFDEVEIAADLLARQPLSHWRYKQRSGYRDKLRGGGRRNDNYGETGVVPP
jgi:uncharacterized protein (DUF934 family)